jgi:hypothetical protein
MPNIEMQPIPPVTFKQLEGAGSVPLNLAVQIGEHQVLMVNFNAEGYFTTDDARLAKELLRSWSRHCAEAHFEDVQVTQRVETKPTHPVQPAKVDRVVTARAVQPG